MVLGTDNLADMKIKHLSRDARKKHLTTLGQELREGRAEKGLEMQSSCRVSPKHVAAKGARV